MIGRVLLSRNPRLITYRLRTTHAFESFNPSIHQGIIPLSDVGKALVSWTALKTQQHKEIRLEDIFAARDTILYKSVWKDVGVTCKAVEEVPFYGLIESETHIERIAVNELDVQRWFVRLGLNWDDIKGCLTPALNYESVARINFTPKSLREHLRAADRYMICREEMESMCANLLQPTNSILRYIAVDIQHSDRSPKKLTQIGTAVLDRWTGSVATTQIIISEHADLKSKYVPEKEKNISYFDSENLTLTTSEALLHLQQLINPMYMHDKQKLALERQRIIVQHQKALDEAVLKSGDASFNGIDKESFEKTLPTMATIAAERIQTNALVTCSQSSTLQLLKGAALDKRGARFSDDVLEAIPKFDVQRMFSHKMEANPSLQPKLRSLCASLRIPTRKVPANAACNAHLAILAFQTLLGAPLTVPAGRAERKAATTIAPSAKSIPKSIAYNNRLGVKL